MFTQENTAVGGTSDHRLVQAGHIIPTSQISIWNRDYKQLITEEPPSQIGESRIYSPRNGLLLGVAQHILFDDYMIGVDPTVSCSTAMPITGSRLT